MPVNHDLAVERLVLREFLAEPRWSIAALKVKLFLSDGVHTDDLDRALVALVVEGVLVHEGATMRLSSCARHLDTLRGGEGEGVRA